MAIVDDSDAAQLAGLPWVFDGESGQLQLFLADAHSRIATQETFEEDARNFETHFARDVRFLHHHCHDHDCSSTCVKNVKKKTKEQLADLLKANRAPPCRFDFFHIIKINI